MLVSLNIKNIALIDDISIALDGGLIVLTGETGAGKSLIVDSICLCLGLRASRDLISAGQKKALVEAAFYTPDADMTILSREIHTDGRNICRINGSLVTLTALRECAMELINIHGQQDAQALLDSKSHCKYLDLIGEIEKDAYRVLYERRRELLNAIKESGGEEKILRLRKLKSDISELDGLKPGQGEDAELEKRLELLTCAADSCKAADEAYETLYNGETSVYSLLNSSINALRDTGLPMKKQLEDALDLIEDAGNELAVYKATHSADANEIELVEERLNAIYDLQRKYKGKDIYNLAKEMKLEYNKLAAQLRLAKEAKEQMEPLTNQVEAEAREISQKRREVAGKIESQLKAELSDLNMHGVEFSVKFTKVPYNDNGSDAVEFLMSTNPSEPLKPMVKIASGGEMSRICLALKTVLSEADPVPTHIFDEIDTGVSGRAAQKIAEKLYSLSKNRQIICITHLPQLAAMADHHLLIEKMEEDGRYVTKLKELDDTERAAELARIIGGREVTETTRLHAIEMLRLARGDF